METPEDYAKRLLRVKNYYIGEIYSKLVRKYNINEINKLIKKLILEEYLNDKILVGLKLKYLITEKLYGKNYIYNYFEKKSISTNLIDYFINIYRTELDNNKDKIIDELIKQGKTEEYIDYYLIKKGY